MMAIHHTRNSSDDTQSAATSTGTRSTSTASSIECTHLLDMKRQNPPSFREHQSTIKIIVGEGQNKKTFDVYKGFLTYYSRYFRNILKCDSCQDSNVEELPETTPEVCGLLIEWLYTQRILDLRCEDMSIEDAEVREQFDKPTMDELVGLFILADKLEISEIKVQTISLLYKKGIRAVDLRHNFIAPAYKNTPPGSALRNLCAVICYKNAPCRPQFLVSPDDFPQEFLMDLICMYSDDSFYRDVTDKINYLVGDDTTREDSE